MTNLLDDDGSKTPAPAGDGAAGHLKSIKMPSLTLPASDGRSVDLSRLSGRTVVFVYPKAGRAGAPAPKGWNAIPGASGCTSQACAFRDHDADFKDIGVENVFGLSTQSTADQQEAATRLNLTFPLLSDDQFRLADAMHLPTFTAPGVRLLQRLTMIIEDGRVVHVLYPVARPDRNPHDVIAWLKTNAR